DRRRQHLFPRQPACRQVLVDAAAYARQAFGEIHEAFIFRLVAHLVPFRVIEILLAAARIASRRLDMAARFRADPDIGPGGRNGEAAYARQQLLVAHEFTLFVITEAGTGLAARNA